MSDTENMKGRMRAAFATTPPGDDRWQAVLDVLHAHGYRRCAEGQRVTQWCDRAEKAEAEVKALRAAANLAANAVNRFSAEADALRAEVELLRKGIAAVSSLIADSSGVYGLHLNGDPAPWDELLSGGRFEEWLADFDEARGES